MHHDHAMRIDVDLDATDPRPIAARVVAPLLALLGGILVVVEALAVTGTPIILGILLLTVAVLTRSLTIAAARRRLLERVAAGLRVLGTAIEGSPEPMVIADLDGTVRFANPAAIELDRRLGHATAPGSPALPFLGGTPDAAGDDRRAWIEAAAERRQRLARRVEVEFTTAGRAAGSEDPLHLHVTASPITSAGGEVEAILLTYRDVTAEAGIRHRLEAARDEARAANVAKSAFVANMSHEIRTPMTAILGYVDLMLDGEHDGPSAEDCLHTIRGNAEHLLAVVNDILDLSKIEAGRMTTESVPTCPRRIVEDVRELLSGRATEAGLALRTVYEGPVPASIRTDPTRLRQILFNLVGNGLKFTQRGSVTVYVACTPADRRMIFRVVDTGVGMTPGQRDAIARFEAFRQADGSTTRRFGGTGLGLRISSVLAGMLGGGLEVESATGIGSTFTVTIDTGPLDDVELLDPASHGSDVPGSIRPAATREDPRTLHGLLAGERILVVEDGPDNQRLIDLHLRRAGAEVEIAANGRLALEAVERRGQDDRPDLILMDMQMPELDGYEATRILRRLGFERPIVALTAHAMDEHVRQCLEAGCTAHLSKPIDRGVLIRSCRARIDAWRASVEADRGAAA